MALHFNAIKVGSSGYPIEQHDSYNNSHQLWQQKIVHEVITDKPPCIDIQALLDHRYKGKQKLRFSTKQGSDVIDLRLTWGKMENLILCRFLEKCVTFLTSQAWDVLKLFGYCQNKERMCLY